MLASLGGLVSCAAEVHYQREGKRYEQYRSDEVRQSAIPIHYRVLEDCYFTQKEKIEAPRKKTTVDERTPLRDAVNMLVGKKGLRYDDAYNMVHQRFAIDSIDELELAQIPLAVEYIHRVVLEGEFIGKQETTVSLPISYPMEYYDQYRGVIGGDSLAAPWRYPARMLEACDEYPHPLGRLLADMKNAGYSIEAAFFQYMAMQHHLERYRQHLDRIKYAVK